MRRLLPALLGLLLLLALTPLATSASSAPEPVATTGNPLLPGNNPDPSIEHLDGRYYVYSTSPDGRRLYAWTSTDLDEWTRSGPIFDRAANAWSNGDTRLWAPDMVERDGRYYLYYSLARNVGVAVCESPVGPCTDTGRPLVTDGTGGIEAIDPMVFIDDDGAAYLYFAGSDSGGRMGTFRLGADMTSVTGSVVVHTPQDFTEGAFVHERGGTYYLTYSNGRWYDDSYNVRYATSTSPLGPWQYRGQLLSSDEEYQGPGHHSLLQYPGTDEWAIVYHRYQGRDFSVRYTAIDQLVHEADGSLRPVDMTSTGVPVRPSGSGGGGGAPDDAVSLLTTTPGYAGFSLRHRDSRAVTSDVGAASSSLDRLDASFTPRPGLADADCTTFESVNYPGVYLRHYAYEVRLGADDGSRLFEEDATFCPEPGRSGRGTSYESYNLDGHYLRHHQARVYVARDGGPNPFETSSTWAEDVSWDVAPAWG